MDIRLHFISIVFLNVIRYGMPNSSCGKLKVHWKGSTCNIRFYPSTEMGVTVTEKFQYRWLQYYLENNAQALQFKKVILQKNSPAPDFNTTKYSENNFTLRIYHVDKSDEGVYQVECFTDEGRFVQSSNVEIRVPPTSVVTTIPPKNSPASAKSTPSIDTAVLVTIAICSVLIVVIISATVCIVVRKKQRPTEGIKRLVSRDASSEPTQRDRVESAFNIYNEIDVENESESAAAMVHPRKPTLPRRSDNQKPENVYDLIALEEESTTVKDTKKNNPKEQENEEIPVYAKVNKPRKRGKEQNNTDDAEAGYVIMFPKINCSEIAVTLGKEYEEMTYPTNEHPRTAYVNFVSRSQRMKSRKVRNSSRKELQYAILDHLDSDTDSIIHIPSKEEEANMTPCQYALIDFNKKAFVAPIRKAPSSWYKRKNKKTKDKLF